MCLPLLWRHIISIPIHLREMNWNFSPSLHFFSSPPSTPPALIGASTFRRTGMVLIWRRCVTTLMCPSHDFCFETGGGAIITVYTHSKKRRLGRRAENCSQPVDGRADVCINERRSRAPMCPVVAVVLHVHVNVHVMALRRR